MGNKAASSASENKVLGERKFPALLDGGKARMRLPGSRVLPENISRIVGEYLIDSREIDHLESAFAGGKPISLCLSQDVGAKLTFCWSTGFLLPHQQWSSGDVLVDMNCVIGGRKGCLDLFNEKSSSYGQDVIEVLVWKLSRTSKEFPSFLQSLRNTLHLLQGRLYSVKRLVVSISNHAFCCFTLKDAIDRAAGVTRPVDHLQVLLQVTYDLNACWENNHMLTASELLAFYFRSDTKRASEKYLSKFVILSNHPLSRNLFKEEAPNTLSNKIMLINCFESYDDFDDVDRETTRLCHAVYLNASSLRSHETVLLGDHFANVFRHHNNPMIERIEINSGKHSGVIRLPRPQRPLADGVPLSALVELSLIGYITIDLTELNTGFFQNLTHLFVNGGVIKGHLDSSSVPRLKTLFLAPSNRKEQHIKVRNSFLHEHVQPIIHAKRPWQLATTRENGGWSLASYDEPIISPQDEAKEGSSHSSSQSLPIIRDLLLVGAYKINAYEWQSKLRSEPSPEANAGDHANPLLVWKPECVEKLTIFGLLGDSKARFEINEAIPGQTWILTSLICHGVVVALNGAAFPNLQSLKLNGADALTPSGCFPQLITLSFDGTALLTPWELNAPLLQSFSCRNTWLSGCLSLHLQRLPLLSFLKINPHEKKVDDTPEIIDDDENGQGLSRVKHVVFGNKELRPELFDRLQVYNVPHLELSVNPWNLPKCWSETVWQCETLTVTVHSASRTKYIVVLPVLPRVKILTVTEIQCHALLDSEMLELAYCTVTSPRMLGPNLKCPALRCIHFSGELSESDKRKFMDRATYSVYGAQPRLVYFDHYGEVHKVTSAFTSEENKMLSLVRPLERIGYSSGECSVTNVDIFREDKRCL